MLSPEKFISVILLAAFSHTVSSIAPKDDPEYAPIVERAMDFQDFTLKTFDGREFNLRRFVGEKKLVIVGFVAAWCKNSNQNGHVVKRLADKYRERGLGVVIVAEYSTPRELEIHINRIGIDYPVVVETTSLDKKKKSAHFRYRRAVEDKRRWGTPFYVIIDARDIQSEGSLLARRIYTVSGEIVEAEAEKFIEQKLAQ